MSVTNSDGTFKLYIEEIPPLPPGSDPQSESGCVIVDNSDEKDLSNVDPGSKRQVPMNSGGMLEEVTLNPAQIEALNGGDDSDTKKARLLREPLRKGLNVLNKVDLNVPKARGGCTISHFVIEDGTSVLIVYGGAARDASNFFNNTSAYIPDKKQWVSCITKGGNALPHRCGHSACVVGGHTALVFGGMDPSTGKCCDDVFSLSVHQNSDKNAFGVEWESIKTSGTPPYARNQHSATLVGNSRMVVYGGSSPERGAFGGVHVLSFSNKNAQNFKDNEFVWSTLRTFGPRASPREMHSACIMVNGRFATESCSASLGDALYYGEAKPLAQSQKKDNAEFESVNAKILEKKQLGNRHFVAGEYEEAIKEYSEAISLDPGCQAALYGNRSACHLKLGNIEDAALDAQRAVRLDSRWGKGYYREGQALLKAGKISLARSALENAVENAGGDSEREQFERILSEISNDPSQTEEEPSSSNDHVCLVVYGGRARSGKVLNDLNILDLKTFTWKPKKFGPTYTCAHSALPTSEGLMHVFGGFDGETVSGASMLYDHVSGSWFDVESKPALTGRFAHSSCSVTPNEGVIFGGSSIQSELNETVHMSIV